MVCEKSVSASLTLWKASFPRQHALLRFQSLTAVTSDTDALRSISGNEAANIMISTRVRIYYKGLIIDNDHFYFGSRNGLLLFVLTSIHYEP